MARCGIVAVLVLGTVVATARSVSAQDGEPFSIEWSGGLATPTPLSGFANAYDRGGAIGAAIGVITVPTDWTEPDACGPARKATGIDSSGPFVEIGLGLVLWRNEHLGLVLEAGYTHAFLQPLAVSPSRYPPRGIPLAAPARLTLLALHTSLHLSRTILLAPPSSRHRLTSATTFSTSSTLL